MKKIEDIHAVIFDMDGVLLDSEKLNVECWIETGEKYNLPGIRDVCMKAVGISRGATKELFERIYGGRMSFEAFAEEAYGLFHSRYDGHIPVKPGAEELLLFLKKRDIPLALASSTMRSMVVKELTDAGLYSFFDQVICGDMVTKSKPDPEIFLTAAAGLSKDPSGCCVIEDSFNGIHAGHAAGMFTIMVPDLLQPTQTIRDLADLVLPSLDEVQKALEGIMP